MGPLETLVRGMFDVVVNKGEIDRVEEFVDPSWQSHTPQGTMDVAGFKDYVRMWRAGFPDIHCDVYDCIEGDGRIAWRVRASGTHTGEFLGIAPTGRKVDFDSMNFGTSRDGVAIEHTVLMDLGTMMTQLGVPTGPSGAAAIIKSGYDAFASQDIEAVLAMFDRTITWYVPESIPGLGGRYNGPDEVLAFFGKLPTVYEPLYVEPDQFIESGTDVVVRGHLRGAIKATGATFAVPFVHCWSVVGGKATSFWEYSDTATFASLLAGIPQQAIRIDNPTPTTHT